MSNLTENRVSRELTEEEMEAALAAVRTLKELLPFFVTTTAAQRQRMPKINIDNAQFVSDVIMVGKQHENILSEQFADFIPEMEKDYRLFQQLGRLELAVKSLLEQIRDTRMVAGNEAYTRSLLFYKMVKTLANVGIPGLEVAYERLKKRFTRRKKSSDE